ncbi:FAD-dependent monooxygenase [Actinomycetospora atypica]|uniref:FAD-dependent monooxygenase n=1 Tax=Actinomycetospora atypica TaxID=1290095 RepID=A0ABV9YN68_9PSEU
MHIVVAGAGLVGLTAAAVLSRAGNEVDVVEQAGEIRAVGAGIGLWDNALRVVGELGLRTPVEAMSSLVDTWFRDPDGTPRRSEGTAAADYRFLLVPRPELNAMLADVVGRDRIRTGTRVVGYDEGPGGVTVRLGDGGVIAADLLVGADGVHSLVRHRLRPDAAAREHGRHTAWRAVVPTRGDERPGGTSLTVGPHGTRGGYTRLDSARTMWMVNQFDAGELTGDRREDALDRAGNLVSEGWHQELLAMIRATPQEAVLENRILLVPPMDSWSGEHVTLIGDAAHGLSPHLSAGGTLGIEDVPVLRDALAGHAAVPEALRAYEQARIPRFRTVREHADAIQRAADATAFADAYARFSHWMVTTAPR